MRDAEILMSQTRRMLSNLAAQLTEQNALTDEGSLDEVPRVRKEMGYPARHPDQPNRERRRRSMC